LGIAPFQPEAVAFRAGRLMLQEIARHVTLRKEAALPLRPPCPERPMHP
jgi:hypothetical protein